MAQLASQDLQDPTELDSKLGPSVAINEFLKNPNQTKPNQTSLPLNAKFSAISHPIELKSCMYSK